MKTILVITLFLSSINLAWNLPDSSILRIVSMESCEATGTSPFDMDFEFKANDKGEKALSYNVTLPQDITDEFTFSLTLNKWVNGKWQKDFYDVEGNLCEYVHRFISKVWKKMSQQLEPKPSFQCPIEAGSYKLVNFQSDSSDIDIPALMYGKFKVTAYFYDEDEEEVLCRILYADIARL